MNVQSLIGKKIDQTQGFLEDGTRVPLSIISVAGNVVTQLKTQEKDGYNAVQAGFGSDKRISKPMVGHLKKAGISTTPRFFREIRVDATPDSELGSAIAVLEIFEPGDIVDVIGTSKGKGYAGVVKRHGFAGGPRTHGQSDRERAPGSSGQTTTPGRVYKGKRMAGRMGSEQVTIKNLEVLDIQGDTILVRGLIPGSKGSTVVIKRVGKNKKFMPLFTKKVEETAVEEKIEVVEELVPTEEEAPKAEAANEVAQEAEVKAEEATEEVKAEEGSDSSKAEESVEEKVEASEEKTEEKSEEVKAADAESSGEPKEAK